jgi:hypothetical protein
MDKGKTMKTKNKFYFMVLVMITAIGCVPNLPLPGNDQLQNEGLTFSEGNGANSGLSDDPFSFTVVSPIDGQNYDGPVAITANCLTDMVLYVSGDIAQNKIINCVNNQFNDDIVLNGNNGSKQINLSLRIVTGDILEDRSMTINRQYPNLSDLYFISPADATYHQGQVQINIHCIPNYSLQIAGVLPTYNQLCPTDGLAIVQAQLPNANQLNLVTIQQITPIGAVARSRNFYSDLIAPTLTLISPADSSQVNSVFNMTFSCSEIGRDVQIGGPGMTNPSTIVCPNNAQITYPVSVTNSIGRKFIDLTQSDAAGWMTNIRYSFLYSPPVNHTLTTVFPAQNQILGAGVTASGTCVPNINFQFSVLNGLGNSGNFSCPASGQWQQAITFTNSGSKTIRVSQSLTSGLVQIDRIVTSDLTPPALAIISPAALTTSKSSLPLVITCEAGAILSLPSASGANTGYNSLPNVTCPANGQYQFSVTFKDTALDGSHVLSLRLSDNFSNQTNLNRSFIKDTTAPALTINLPPSLQTISSMLLSGQCETGLPINVSGDIDNPISNLACANSQYQYDVTLSGLPGPNKIVRFQQTDAALNIALAQITLEKIVQQTLYQQAVSAFIKGECFQCHGINFILQNVSEQQFIDNIVNLQRPISPSIPAAFNGILTFDPAGNALPNSSKLVTNLKFHTPPGDMPEAGRGLAFTVQDYFKIKNWVTSIIVIPQSNNPDLSRKFELPYGTREYVFSVFKDIFGQSLANMNLIIGNAQQNVGSQNFAQAGTKLFYQTMWQSNGFGGPCNIYDTAWARSTPYPNLKPYNPERGCPSGEDDMALPSRSSPSVTREAWIMNTCELVVNDVNSRTYALTRIRNFMGLASIPVPSPQSIQYAYQLFYPGKTYPGHNSAPVQALMSLIYDNGVLVTDTNQQWKRILLAMCVHPETFVF